jgi:KDO transferase-3
MLTLRYDENRRYLCEGEKTILLKDFNACRNKYSGCLFLLASGSSAATFPISKYAHIPFIAMNGSIKRLVDENIKPLFYMCDDKGFVTARPDLAMMGVKQAQHIAMSLKCLQTLHKFDPEALASQHVYLLERVNRYYDQKPLSDRHFAWSIRRDPDMVSGFSLLKQKPNRIGFSRNLRKGYFAGRTIPYAATQLAYSLGFRKVFIIGMDLRASTGRFYEQKHDALPTSLDDDFNKFILPSFKIMADKVIAKEDFKVYNLSIESRMPADILPKIHLEQLDPMLKD